jgi:hypothetical protein
MVFSRRRAGSDFFTLSSSNRRNGPVLSYPHPGGGGCWDNTSLAKGRQGPMSRLAWLKIGWWRLRPLSPVYNARMTSSIHPLRLLLKTVLLVLAFEIPFASAPIPFGATSSYELLQMPRDRLPISTRPAVDAALDVGNLDAMFASHIVSRPKAADEFRVMVFGDSAVWGLQLPASDTLPSQLDRLGLVCGEKQLRFYNLSFPRSSATKDLMLLDKAQAYQPDLIVWLITWYTLMPKTRVDHWLVTRNPGEFEALARRFDFLPKDYRTPTLWDDVINQNSSLFRVARFQLYPLIQLATRRDQVIGPAETLPTALSADTTFEGMKPPLLRPAQVSLDQVQDFYDLAGSVPVILVNEPMLVVHRAANSDIRYNNYYPRWVYDQYRTYVQQAASEHRWDYLDLWDAIPPEYFADTPLHLVPAGQGLLAKTLVPSIEKACP